MRDDHCFYQFLSRNVQALVDAMEFGWRSRAARQPPEDFIGTQSEVRRMVIDDTLWLISLQLRLMCCLAGKYGL